MADQTDNWWAQDAAVPTGEAYLKTLDPARAAQVKALAEGRMELPKGVALRSPTGAALLNDVAQYDPSFDVANANSRIAARKAFTSGKQGQNIASFNTALGHLETLAQRAEELDNGHFPMWNHVANAAETATGDPRVSNFNIARAAVADELTRAFRGTGGNVADIKEWQENIHTAQSPEQLRGAIKQAADLLKSRVEALGQQYTQAMGTTQDPFVLLSPHAREAMDRFEAPGYLNAGLAANPAAAPPGAPPGSPPSASPAPAVPPGGSPPPVAPLDPYALPSGPQDGGGATSAATRTERDEKVSQMVDQMIRGGASAADINAKLQPLGHDPVDQGLVTQWQKFLKAHPGFTGSTANATHPVEQSIGQRVAGSALGSAAIAGADATLFGTLPKIVAGVNAVGGRLGGDNRPLGDIWDSELANADVRIGASRAAHPVAALGGDIAGFIAGDAALGAIPGVAGLAARLPTAVRPVVGDALYGAALGTGSSEHLADIPGNAALSAVAAAGGGVAGRQVLRAAAALASPVANGAVQRLTNAGITLTPGQILGAGGGVVGRTVRGVEDRLAGFPVVGDIINSTRRTGTEEFNRAAINDALAPINGALPTNVAAGHDAVAHARQLVSDEYDTALGSMTVRPDAQLTTDLQAAAARARGQSQANRDRLASIMDNDVQPYLAGRTQLGGGDVQALKRGLDTRISNLRGQGSSPQDRELADTLGEVRDAILDTAGRSDPANAAAFQRANQAYSLLSRVEAAAAKSRDGVFTPNQFRQAVTRRGYGTTTANVAAGSAPMQQLATDASTILPSTVPDSGTAGRSLLGAGMAKLSAPALGGGAGFLSDGQEGALTGAVVGGALLSRPGARAVQWALAGSRGPQLNTLGALLRRNASLGGAAGTPLLLQTVPNDGP